MYTSPLFLVLHDDTFNYIPFYDYRLQVGPLRCWPGGLCLSRSIGDTDVGEYIVPIPHVKQVKVTSQSFSNCLTTNRMYLDYSAIFLFWIIQLSNAGGRLIIASDGIWDTLSSDMAAKSCRGLPAELAAKLVVKVGFNYTF